VLDRRDRGGGVVRLVLTVQRGCTARRTQPPREALDPDDLAADRERPADDTELDPLAATLRADLGRPAEQTSKTSRLCCDSPSYRRA